MSADLRRELDLLEREERAAQQEMAERAAPGAGGRAARRRRLASIMAATSGAGDVTVGEEDISRRSSSSAPPLPPLGGAVRSAGLHTFAQRRRRQTQWLAAEEETTEAKERAEAEDRAYVDEQLAIAREQRRILKEATESPAESDARLNAQRQVSATTEAASFTHSSLRRALSGTKMKKSAHFGASKATLERRLSNGGIGGSSAVAAGYSYYDVPRVPRANYLLKELQAAERELNDLLFEDAFKASSHGSGGAASGDGLLLHGVELIDRREAFLRRAATMHGSLRLRQHGGSKALRRASDGEGEGDAAADGEAVPQHRGSERGEGARFVGGTVHAREAAARLTMLREIEDAKRSQEESAYQDMRAALRAQVLLDVFGAEEADHPTQVRRVVSFDPIPLGPYLNILAKVTTGPGESVASEGMGGRLDDDGKSSSLLLDGIIHAAANDCDLFAELLRRERTWLDWQLEQTELDRQDAEARAADAQRRHKWHMTKNVPLRATDMEPPDESVERAGSMRYNKRQAATRSPAAVHRGGGKGQGDSNDDDDENSDGEGVEDGVDADDVIFSSSCRVGDALPVTPSARNEMSGSHASKEDAAVRAQQLRGDIARLKALIQQLESSGSQDPAAGNAPPASPARDGSRGTASDGDSELLPPLFQPRVFAALYRQDPSTATVPSEEEEAAAGKPDRRPCRLPAAGSCGSAPPRRIRVIAPSPLVVTV